jgi:hypothetical protein
MLTANAFSIRNAISGESEARALTRSDRVARRTPSTSAARATDKPNSFRISSRMNSPGWAGLIPILVISSLISDSPQDRDHGHRRCPCET